MKQLKYTNEIKNNKVNASLTVETSLVLPIFLFFFMIFLYFMQIIIIQESLQKAITETGFSMARAAYIYSDFYDVNEAEEFDKSFLEEGIGLEFEAISNAVKNKVLIKRAVADRLNMARVNNSCIIGGFDGISFDNSKVLQDSNNIDIVAEYRVRIPIHTFGLFEMDMIQRVRLRGWNGHQLPALYTMAEEEDDNNKKIVYITETGTVYHLDRNCSHIKLSVRESDGIPTWLRNNDGKKYHPCESCLKNEHPKNGIYYITSYGERYHKNKDCSGIKRTVRQIPLSEVGVRKPCKRCGGG